MRDPFASPFGRTVFVILLVLAVGLLYAQTHIAGNSSALITQALGSASDLLVPALILVIGGGIGRLLIGRLTGVDPMIDRDRDAVPYPLRLSDAERVALEAGVGLGTLSLITMLLGLIGLFHPADLRVFLLITALIAVRWSITWIRDLVASVRSAFNTLTVWTALLAFFCVFMVGTALLVALTPPATWDTLVYHLPIPTHYLAVGRIDANPDNPFFGFAQASEMIYALVLAVFGRDTAVAPMHWLYAILAFMAIGGFIRRYVDQDGRGNGRATGWFAIAILLSGYGLWQLLGWAYIDLATMLYGALVVIALMQWRFIASPKRRADWLILTGLFLAFAFLTKYPAGIVAIAAVVFVAWYSRRAGMIAIGRAVLWMAIPALIVSLGWFVKDLILYGNPIYPYLINGLNWNTWRSAMFNDVGLGYLKTNQLNVVLTIPVSGTIYGISDKTGFGADVGLWLFMGPIMFPGYGALPKSIRAVAGGLFLLIVPGWLLWAIAMSTTGIGWQTRFVTPLFGSIAMLGALGFYGVTRWLPRPINLSRFIQIVVAFTLVIQMVNAGLSLNNQHTITYLSGEMDRKTFLIDTLGSYAYTMQQLATLPKQARVLMLWEPRGYECPPDIACTPDSMVDRWANLLANGKTPPQIYSDWRQRFEYILVYTDGYTFEAQQARNDAAYLPVFDQTRAQWLTPVWSAFGYVLYTWKTTPASFERF